MAAGVRLYGSTYIVTFHDGHVTTFHGPGAKKVAERRFQESIGRYWGLCSSCGRYEFQDISWHYNQRFGLVLSLKCQRGNYTSSTGYLPSYIHPL